MAGGAGGLPQHRHGALARVPLAPAAAEGIPPQRPLPLAERASRGHGDGGSAAEVVAEDVGIR